MKEFLILLSGIKIIIKNNLMNKKLKLAIIGLGYVGLPLALEFAKKKTVIGFDINKKRIKELIDGFDKNLEFSKKNLIIQQN